MGSTRTAQLNITLLPAQRRWVRARARKMRCSESEVIRRAIETRMAGYGMERFVEGKRAEAKA